MPTDIIPDWSPNLLIYFGVGYLAYRSAYVGLNKHHTARDSLFMVLIFAAGIGWPSYNLGLYIQDSLYGPSDIHRHVQEAIATLASAIIAVLIGLLWRTKGKKWWQNSLARWWDIREDGIPSAWDSFVIETHSRVVWQVAVHTKDRTYYMIDRSKYLNAPLEGVYLGTDGDVALIVDKIQENGKMITPQKVIDDYYGARLTYIPSSEITRVEIRLN